MVKQRNDQRGDHDLIGQLFLGQRQDRGDDAQHHGDKDERKQDSQLVVGESARSQQADGAVSLLGERQADKQRNGGEARNVERGEPAHLQ